MGIRFFKQHRIYELLLGLAALVLLFLGVQIIFGEKIERHFIYFPVRQVQTDPSHLELPFEDIYFMAEDGVKLHGWFVPGDKNLTWLWFHGNAGNISHRLENLALIHEKLGVSVFLFDYRGYGNSEGKPSEKGTYLDAEAALNYLYSRTDIRNNPIVYFGQSLGTAIAVDLAIQHSPSGLILEAAFPSVPYMAHYLYPFLPIWPFLSTRYDTITKIGRIEVPLLVLHGDKDDVIPLEAGQNLFEAARGEKSFYVIPGSNHNDTYLVGSENYFQELRRFIQKLE